MVQSQDDRRPPEVWAQCSREQAEQLAAYDHHRVLVDGHWGIMITYHWMPVEEAREPLMLKVIFNPAPRRLLSPEQIRWVIFKHPLAPADVQEIVSRLAFAEAGGG